MAGLLILKRVAYMSVTWALSPVTFPPGRARLATRPDSTGAPLAAMTTGMVRDALFAARAAGVPLVTIRSTFSRTSSAARTGYRSSRPSAERYSMTKFFVYLTVALVPRGAERRPALTPLLYPGITQESASSAWLQHVTARATQSADRGVAHGAGWCLYPQHPRALPGGRRAEGEEAEQG